MFGPGNSVVSVSASPRQDPGYELTSHAPELSLVDHDAYVVCPVCNGRAAREERVYLCPACGGFGCAGCVSGYVRAGKPCLACGGWGLIRADELGLIEAKIAAALRAEAEYGPGRVVNGIVQTEA